MGEVRFMISEAAKQVHVESHVLRYWEEELNLKIGRTEMGHRYYTEDDIQLFRCIQKLKNEGMLLRDLKPLIPELTATRKKLVSARSTLSKEETGSDTSANAADDGETGSTHSIHSTKELMKSGNSASKAPTDITDNNVHTDNLPKTTHTDNSSENKQGTSLTVTQAEVIPVTQLEQVRGLIGDVLTEVVTANNEVLEKNISKKVTGDVLREMDFLFQAKERREEEHFRKLDMLIRQQQTNRKDAARENPIGKLRKILT